MPLQPDTVLSKLDVQLRTPTPPALTEALWEALYLLQEARTQVCAYATVILLLLFLLGLADSPCDL